MVELVVVNSFLDVLVKVLGLVLGGYILFLLINLNQFIRKAESSIESVESTAEEVEALIRWSRILPFVGGRDE